VFVRESSRQLTQ